MPDCTLKPDRIVRTIAVLRLRIEERFPESGLSQVCSDLYEIAKKAEAKSAWFGQPVRWLRILCWVISVLIVWASGMAVYLMLHEDRPQGIGLTEFVQVAEAAINDVVLIGAAIFFLLSAETRYKRTRALSAIHELRSLAHIIDMHQLTKDPERIMNPAYLKTETSPKTKMTRFELRRYLDYCSEMLSLTGKIGAVYVERFSDSVALVSANEVETLTTGLCRKIWQKMSLLNDHDEVWDDAEERHRERNKS